MKNKEVLSVNGSTSNKKYNNAMAEMTLIFNQINQPTYSFNPANLDNSISEYVKKYNRIFYSRISELVYEYSLKEIFNATDASNNLLETINYVNSISSVNSTQEADRVKIYWKIIDHLKLAKQQYEKLHEDDTEFNKWFNSKIAESTREISAQLVSLVGIFTALAFLIFGSISSLNSIFGQMSETPVFKLLIAGCVWGIGITDAVFVFLFCIGKMTGLSFKSNMSTTATIFQRYPIVCWTNCILILMLFVFMILYYLTNYEIDYYFILLIRAHPVRTVAISAFVILVIICSIVSWLVKASKMGTGTEDQ